MSSLRAKAKLKQLLEDYEKTITRHNIFGHNENLNSLVENIIAMTSFFRSYCVNESNQPFIFFCIENIFLIIHTH